MIHKSRAHDKREAAPGETASEEPLDRLRDDVPQRTEVPLEPMFVLADKPVEELVDSEVMHVRCRGRHKKSTEGLTGACSECHHNVRRG